MEPNRRFSILPFPQSFDGSTLTLNIVVLPRNHNPLKQAIESVVGIADPGVSLAEAEFAFKARIVSSLAGFPNNHSPGAALDLATTPPTGAKALFEALAANFSIVNLGVANTNANVNSPLNDPPPAAKTGFPIRKYLPLSYRGAFNFTTPRTRAAVTDDSYHCAIRDAKKVDGFQKSPEAISWGKVFAFALRQPLLARRLGMIYTASFEVKPSHFPAGGWLYVDLAEDSDFLDQMKAADGSPGGSFVRKYAARIPALTPGTARPLFAPLLFPVLYKKNAGDPDPAPDGSYDQLFIEAAEYDDGFAKIVHAMQPKSRNFLGETPADGKPVKDAGIRLGWDDEQILIWYLRQLAQDASVSAPDKRLDAPLGVFGYAIDVRETGAPEKPWETLNEVESTAPLAVPTPPQGAISLGDFEGELPYQVYPMQLDGNLAGTYWLPMYFANWGGHSMVLPDKDAVAIYRHAELDPAKPANAVGTEVQAPDNNLSKRYQAAPLQTLLRYGRQYDFRVRMRDLSGGGAAPDAVPVLESPSAIHTTPFRRYVSPNQPRLEDLPVNSDAPGDPDSLTIRRPLLGYPAVVYTGKYADPVTRLVQASNALAGKEAFGIPDPDVDRIEITVEVETLKLDNLLSVSGKENYVHLYTTERLFPTLAGDYGFAAALNIPVVYKDVKVLHLGDELDLEGDLGLAADIDDLQEIVLPTARRVRLTMRAVCEEKDDDGEYYGLINPAEHDLDSRYGHVVEVWCYRESSDETDLFVDSAPSQRLRGIFLQPDPPQVFDGKLATLFFGKETPKPPDMVQRLAKQLGLETAGLTLVAPKGERVQFGCSSRIRHTLSPDNSSLTFSSKGDLANHWLVCIELTIDRDWMWNALEDRSFAVERTLRFSGDDPATETETKAVGDIEMRRTASFEMLHSPKRNYTRLVFIDAVEPKNERMRPSPHQTEPRFPATIEASYAITTFFKQDHAAEQDEPETISTVLPVTTPPSQVPKVASAGIALSPYVRNEKYSATEPRRRFLWVEFEEPVADPNDTYFARMLAYSPDQLISNNHPELFVAPEEPALPIDPEETRVVIPGATNDLAGLTAMQAMTKAEDSDRHYLLPLPPGLHADADELFGLFTYEFRVGHFRHKDTLEMAWTTAQGRFGRRLKATGIQHPAPALTCAVNRDENKLWVVAPYAVAVFDGKNVTADPPRTQLWCLLYAQVRQADNLDFRNILLDDKQLDWRVQVEDEPGLSPFLRYDEVQLRTLRNVALKNAKIEVGYAQLAQSYKLTETETLNKDAKKYGTAIWSNDEVAQWLNLFGLPEDSPLSVLVVEVLPQITNIFDHASIEQQAVNLRIRETMQSDLPSPERASEFVAARRQQADFQQGRSPVNDELGHHRILRTSPLTEVPFVCCPTCE
ncbi:hypothetical protein [Taklimakanibacter deserti]|uniref:hypothetical protein n=1 Tax=Taklimakanibacter deserti TaxID=2267839 RepID=UPI0013C4FF82